MSDGRFQKGQSGNPSGRPSGARHRTTMALEAMLETDAKAITGKAVELALTGDITAIRLCMDRLLPVRRDRHVSFALPKLETPADALQAVSAVAEAVAEGELTPMEAAELSRVVDGFSRALEAVEFEQRLAKLEMERDK
jgi:Family of unknown function (DUF5681)